MEPVGLVFQVAGINHSYQATDESDIESMNLNCILLYNTVPDGIPGHTRLQRDSLRPPTQGFQSKHLCHRPLAQHRGLRSTDARILPLHFHCLPPWVGGQFSCRQGVSFGCRLTTGEIHHMGYGCSCIDSRSVR